jgi:hypothetical protein
MKGNQTMITMIPAYGRDYTNAKKAIADWKAGKDFIVMSWGHPFDTKPANINDMKNEKIMLRFSRLEKMTVL